MSIADLANGNGKKPKVDETGMVISNEEMMQRIKSGKAKIIGSTDGLGTPISETVRTAPENAPPAPGEVGFMENFSNRFQIAMDSVQKSMYHKLNVDSENGQGLGAIIEDIAGDQFWDDRIKAQDAEISEEAKRIKQINEDNTPLSVSNFLKKGSDYIQKDLPELLGSSAGLMGVSLGAGLAGSLAAGPMGAFVGMAAGASVGRYTESLAEAGDAYDATMQALVDHNKTLPLDKRMSKEEMQKRALIASDGTFNKNMALLLLDVPAAMLSFGIGGKMMTNIFKKSALSQMVGETIATNSLASAGKTAAELAAVSAMEGGEEGLQFYIQNQESAKALGKEYDPSLAELWQNDEFRHSVYGGIALGSLMHTAGHVGGQIKDRFQGITSEKMAKKLQQDTRIATMYDMLERGREHELTGWIKSWGDPKNGPLSQNGRANPEELKAHTDQMLDEMKKAKEAYYSVEHNFNENERKDAFIHAMNQVHNEEEIKKLGAAPGAEDQVKARQVLAASNKNLITILSDIKKAGKDKAKLDELKTEYHDARQANALLVEGFEKTFENASPAGLTVLDAKGKMAARAEIKKPGVLEEVQAELAGEKKDETKTEEGKPETVKGKAEKKPESKGADTANDSESATTEVDDSGLFFDQDAPLTFNAEGEKKSTPKENESKKEEDPKKAETKKPEAEKKASAKAVDESVFEATKDELTQSELEKVRINEKKIEHPDGTVTKIKNGKVQEFLGVTDKDISDFNGTVETGKDEKGNKTGITIKDGKLSQDMSITKPDGQTQIVRNGRSVPVHEMKDKHGSRYLVAFEEPLQGTKETGESYTKGIGYLIPVNEKGEINRKGIINFYAQRKALGTKLAKGENGNVKGRFLYDDFETVKKDLGLEPMKSTKEKTDTAEAIKEKQEKELNEGKTPKLPDYLKEDFERTVNTNKQWLSKVRELAYEGYTRLEIAKKLGIDKEVVNALRTWMNIPSMDHKTEYAEWKAKIDSINKKYEELLKKSKTTETTKAESYLQTIGTNGKPRYYRVSAEGKKTIMKKSEAEEIGLDKFEKEGAKKTQKKAESVEAPAQSKPFDMAKQYSFNGQPYKFVKSYLNKNKEFVHQFREDRPNGKMINVPQSKADSVKEYTDLFTEVESDPLPSLERKGSTEKHTIIADHLRKGNIVIGSVKGTDTTKPYVELENGDTAEIPFIYNESNAKEGQQVSMKLNEPGEGVVITDGGGKIISESTFDGKKWMFVNPVTGVIYDSNIQLINADGNVVSNLAYYVKDEESKSRENKKSKIKNQKTSVTSPLEAVNEHNKQSLVDRASKWVERIQEQRKALKSTTPGTKGLKFQKDNAGSPLDAINNHDSGGLFDNLSPAIKDKVLAVLESAGLLFIKVLNQTANLNKALREFSTKLELGLPEDGLTEKQRKELIKQSKKMVQSFGANKGELTTEQQQMVNIALSVLSKYAPEEIDDNEMSSVLKWSDAAKMEAFQNKIKHIIRSIEGVEFEVSVRALMNHASKISIEDEPNLMELYLGENSELNPRVKQGLIDYGITEENLVALHAYYKSVVLYPWKYLKNANGGWAINDTNKSTVDKKTADELLNDYFTDDLKEKLREKRTVKNTKGEDVQISYYTQLMMKWKKQRKMYAQKRTTLNQDFSQKFAKSYSEIMQIEAYKKAFVDTGLLRAKTYYNSIKQTISEVEKVFNDKFETLSKITDESERLRKTANLERAKAKIIKALNEDNNKVYKAKNEISQEIADLDVKLMKELTGMPEDMIRSLFDIQNKGNYVKNLTEDFSFTRENNQTLWKILRPQQQRFHEKSNVIGTDALNHRDVEAWIESYTLTEKGTRSYANEISIDIAVNKGESLMSLDFTGTDDSRKDATRFLSNLELASRNIMSEEVQNSPRFANNDFVKDHADHAPVIEMFSDVSNPEHDKTVVSDKMTMFDMWAVQMKYFEQAKKDKQGKLKFKMHLGQLGDSSLKAYIEVERKSTEDAKAKAKELGLLKGREKRIETEINTTKALLRNLSIKGLIVDSSIAELAENFVYNYMINRHFVDEYYKDLNAFKDKDGNIKMGAVAKRDKTIASPGVQLVNVKGGIYDLPETKPGKHNVFIANDEKETVKIAKVLEEGFHEFKDVELTNGFTFHSEVFDQAITKSSGNLLGSGPSGKMEGISKAIYSDNDLEHGRVIIKSNSIVLTKKMAEQSPALMQIYKMMNRPGKPIHRFTFTSSAKAVGTMGAVEGNKIFNTKIFTNKPNIFEADSSKFLVQQDLTNPTVFNEEKMPVQVFRYLTNFDMFDKISDIYKEIMQENVVKTKKFFASIGTEEWKNKLLSQLDDTPQNQQVRTLLADKNVTRDHPTIKAIEANLLKSIVTKDVFDRIANKTRMIEMPDYKVDSKLKGIRIETIDGKKVMGLPQAMVSSDYKNQLIEFNGKKVMFIVRVPTTGMHSISLVEVVDFLDPKMKNTIITDRGTQQKAGSDNDGDARYCLSTFKGGNLSKKERLANDVIRHMIAEYVKVDNFDLLNEPINTAAVDKAVEAVESKIGGNKAEKADIYMYSDMVKMFINNSESQTGIGHAATFNAFHQFAKKFGFSVKSPITLPDFKTGQPITKSSFSLPKDKKEALAVMARVANITNIIVDNPNLQMMDRAGLSTATTTPFMTLLALGFDYETVISYFRQPIVQDYIRFMREKESPLISREDSNEWDYLYEKYSNVTRQEAIDAKMQNKDIEHLKSIIALANDVTNIARIVKANEIAATRFEDFYSVLSGVLDIKNLKVSIPDSFYKNKNEYHSALAPLVQSMEMIHEFWEKSIYLNPLFGRSRKNNGDAHGILAMFEMNSKRSMYGYNTRQKNEKGVEIEKFETIKPKEIEAFKRNVDQWIVQRALNITESQKELEERSVKIYEEHIKGTDLAKAFRLVKSPVNEKSRRLEITAALTSKNVTIDQVQGFRDEMAKLPLEVRYDLMKHQAMAFGSSTSTRNGGFMILFDAESNQILSQKITGISDNLSDLSFIQKFKLFKEFCIANPAILPESKLAIVNGKVVSRTAEGSNEVGSKNLPFAVKVFNQNEKTWEVWGITVAGINNYTKLGDVNPKAPKVLFTVDEQLNYKFEGKKEANVSYKGGFEDKGKGTPQGDGKDKAMREIADGFIGEIAGYSRYSGGENGTGQSYFFPNEDSSTATSLKIIHNRKTVNDPGKNNTRINKIYQHNTDSIDSNYSDPIKGKKISAKQKDGSVKLEQAYGKTYSSTTAYLKKDVDEKYIAHLEEQLNKAENETEKNKAYIDDLKQELKEEKERTNYFSPKTIMLARNSEFAGQELNQHTKKEIKEAHKSGAEFVVGDMPNVDSQFIDYLQEIGAKFTIYHTGEKSRITVNQSSEKAKLASEQKPIDIWHGNGFNTSIGPEVHKQNSKQDISEFTNHSGGAIGSDTEWDEIGKEFGMINNNHYWTETKTPKGNKEISKEDFEEGRIESAKAAKRNFDYQYKTMKDSRLIRNWSQVKHSEAIFAIGKIVDIGEKIFPNQKNDTRTAKTPSVTGGTGYAVGMGINNNKSVYIFNQSKSTKYDTGWYKWDSELNDFIKTETPILTKNFAGIGTRRINEQGKQAIRDVYEKTKESLNDNNSSKQQRNKAELASEQKPIDIWHGNGFNTSIGPEVQLSNLAHRPFTLDHKRLNKKISYYSVEHAYQSNKSGKFDEAIYNDPAWKQGKIVKGAKTDKASNYELMKRIVIKSFEQNPEALKTLINTGNVPFSHSKAVGFWQLKFPQLLDEVRTYFKKLKNQFEGQQEKLASSDPELNEFIRARLAKKFPNVTLFNSRNTFEKFLAKYHNGEQLDIDAVGAAIGNSVFIDEKKSFQSTAIHEHAHIYWDSLPANDSTKLKILKFVGEVFPNITDPAEIEEMAIQVIGEKGVLLAQQQLRGTMLARLKGMLEVFWRKVKNAFGLLNGKESIDKILDDIWNKGTTGNNQNTIKFQKQTGVKGTQSNFREVMNGFKWLRENILMQNDVTITKEFSTKEEREAYEYQFKNTIKEKRSLGIKNGKNVYEYDVDHHYLVNGISHRSASEARRIAQPELYDIPFVDKAGIDERGYTDSATKNSSDYRARNIGTPIHKIMEDVIGNGITIEEAYKEATDENNPNRLFENTPFEVIKKLVEEVDETVFKPLRDQGYEFTFEQPLFIKGLWAGTADVIATGIDPITGGVRSIVLDFKTSDKSILGDGYDKPRGQHKDKSSKKREHQVQMGMYANALGQKNGKFPGVNVTSMAIIGLNYKLDGKTNDATKNRKIKSFTVSTDWTDYNDDVREIVAEMHAGLEDNLMVGQSDSHFVDRATFAKDSGVEDENFIQESITAFRRVCNLMKTRDKKKSLREHAEENLGVSGMPATMEEFAMGMMFWGETQIDGMDRLEAYEKTGQLKMKEANAAAFEMADPINGDAKAKEFMGRWNRFNKNYKAYQKAHVEITRRMTNTNLEEASYEDLLKDYNEMAKMDSVAFNNIAMAKYNEAIMRKAAERQMRQEVSKTELKNTADIDKYDVKFTALSDFSKEHPVVQDMAKDYYRIMRASQSETKQILEKMNKLGKDVIQDYLVRNGKTDVWNRIKAWINPIIDNQEYFAELWDDEGNMKLSTDPSLSTAQKAYLKNLESFNTRRDVAAIMGDKKPKKNSGLHLHEDTFESFMNAKKIGGWTAGVLSSLKTFMGANYYVEEVKIPVTTVSGKRLMKLGDYLNYLEGSSESTFDKGKKMTKAILQARKAKRAGYHLDINGALNAADPIGADEMGSTYKMVNGELRRQYLTDMGSKSIDRNMKIKSQWHFNKPDKFKYTKNVHRAATQFVKDMMFEKHLQGYDDNGNIDHSNALFTKILALQGWAQLNQKENTAKMMDLFVDGKILGIKQPSDMGEGKDKFMDLLFSWTFYTTMPFNVPLAGFNVVIGQVNNFINGKSANALKGNKRYLKDRAKASAILDHLKVVSVNEDINPYDTISSHFTKSAMWMIEKGEEYIQGSAFLGAMPDDVYDSIVVAEDGTVTIPKWTQQEQEEFVAQQGKKITDIQGKYWEGDKRLYGLFATWRLMGQFKTWLPDTLRLFFKKEETNMYGDRSKGILRTTGEHGLTLIRALRTMSLQPVKDGFKFMSENWNNDNDPDAVNMRRELKSLCLIGVMVGAYAMLHGDSPEEKKRGETIIKLIKQIMVPFDLDTWKSIATIPATRTVGLIADLIHQIFTMSVYERASEWGKKGDVKFIDTASKLVPYSRVASTIDQYAGLGIMKNPTYGKKH